MPPSSRKKAPAAKIVETEVLAVDEAVVAEAPYQRDHSKPQLEVWERLDCGHGIILFTDVGQPLPQIHELVICPRCNTNRIILGAILAQPALP